MKDLFELYALEKSGLGCLDSLEKMLAAELGITQEELAAKYDEITNKINSSASGYSDKEFRNLIYQEYQGLDLHKQIIKRGEFVWGTF